MGHLRLSKGAWIPNMPFPRLLYQPPEIAPLQHDAFWSEERVAISLCLLYIPPLLCIRPHEAIWVACETLADPLPPRSTHTRLQTRGSAADMAMGSEEWTLSKSPKRQVPPHTSDCKLKT